jgi:O-acetyl-ADP-ribose deacetylase (regulator of RNase III)
MPFTIIRNDITKMQVDAIVNAANTGLAQGGGVCGAIFKAAGARELQAACDKLAPIKTGEAVITPGFALPAKYVIHAAGPVYRGGGHGEEELLRAAYTNSLKRAVENNCESIAFPLISSGIYGYPKDEALRVAASAIRDFIGEHDIDVSLVVFDNATFTAGRELLGLY